MFAINFVPIISNACEFYNVPYLCWIVDSPVIQLYSAALFNPCNYAFVFDRTLFLEFCEKVPGHMFYLSLGCDVEWFDAINITPEEQERFGADVSFVGSLYSEKCIYNTLEERLPDYLRGFFDGVLHAQSKIYGYNFLREILNEQIVDFLRQCVSISQGNDYEIDERILFGNMILNPKCTEIERIHLLNRLGERFAIDLYTESDTTKLKHIRCRGSVSSLDGMPKVFKCSKINLNFTAKGIQSGASLRVFDVLGCGGFLISNYQQELSELFVDGKELVLFESEQDLMEKVDYYLKHDEVRQEIAQNGYQKVKQEYSYQKRLEIMLETYKRYSCTI